MSKENLCNGSKAGPDTKPVKLPEGGWGVWIPLYIGHPNLALPGWCKGADYAAILSPQVDGHSTIGWAGPLGCFPAETPRNEEVKRRLIEEHGADAFFAVVDNEDGSHIAPLALTAVEEGENYFPALSPCTGCPKFEEHQGKESSTLEEQNHNVLLATLVAMLFKS